MSWLLRLFAPSCFRVVCQWVPS